MKLLVPVDGSAASFNAAKKSAEIAVNYGAHVILLTVADEDLISRHSRNESLWSQVDGSSITGRTKADHDEEFNEALRKNALALQDSITEKLDFGDAKVDKVVLFGEPYHMILETAKGVKADLIVMGNRGFSKIKRFFVGSVTQKVISEAPCPVLVIHTDEEN